MGWDDGWEYDGWTGGGGGSGDYWGPDGGEGGGLWPTPRPEAPGVPWDMGKGDWGGKGKVVMGKGVYPSSAAPWDMGKGLYPSSAAPWGPPGAPWPYAPPQCYAHSVANSNTLADAWKSGWHAGRAVGFKEGIDHDAQKRQEAPARNASESDEDGSDGDKTGGAKQKRKRKGNKGQKWVWKQFMERYTAVDEDDSAGPHYKVKLGKDTYETYPQEVQTMLREMAQVVEAQTAAREMDYDMTGGFVFTLRLFPPAEKEWWAEVLGKHDEADYVGAQWDKSKGSPPRDVFDEKVQFRPILFK